MSPYVYRLGGVCEDVFPLGLGVYIYDRNR